MITVMQAEATPAQISEVKGALQEWGYEMHPIYGVERKVIAAVGAPTQDEARVAEQVESRPGFSATPDILLLPDALHAVDIFHITSRTTKRKRRNFVTWLNNARIPHRPPMLPVRRSRHHNRRCVQPLDGMVVIR